MEPGKEYKYLAVGGGVDHYGTLPSPPVGQYQSVLKFLSAEWAKAEKKRQEWRTVIFGLSSVRPVDVSSAKPGALTARRKLKAKKFLNDLVMAFTSACCVATPTFSQASRYLNGQSVKWG